MAAVHEDEDLVRILLLLGADVFFRNSRRQTVLDMVASTLGQGHAIFRVIRAALYDNE
jgi:hypothetical protein